MKIPNVIYGIRTVGIPSSKAQVQGFYDFSYAKCTTIGCLGIGKMHKSGKYRGKYVCGVNVTHVFTPAKLKAKKHNRGRVDIAKGKETHH